MRPEPIDLHNISKIYEPEVEEKEEKVELKESTRPVKRGEVYYAKCFHCDAGLGETNRPAVIVSNDGINEKGNFVNVIYLTTAPKTSHPCHVSVECKKQHATAVCERIQSIGKCHLGDYIETLSDNEMFQIDHGIEIANS